MKTKPIDLPIAQHRHALMEIGARINGADNLDHLKGFLNAFEAEFKRLDETMMGDAEWDHEAHYAGVDICALPTFGVYEGDTTGIWSWDETRFLYVNDHVWYLEVRVNADDDQGDEDDACTDPGGHRFVCTGTAYGGDDASYHGEGRSYCEHCGADGDA